MDNRREPRARRAARRLRHHGPTPGPAWGYFADSGSVPSLRVVVFYPDRPTCEVNRVRNQGPPAATVAWAKMAVAGAACVPLRVTVPGGDWWALAVHDGIVGFSGADWCAKAQAGLAGTARHWSTCEAIDVREAR